MFTYQAPVDDYLFLLTHVFDYKRQVSELPGQEDVGLELVGAILDELGKFASEKLAKINRSGDEEGCTWHGGQVCTPAGFREAYDSYRGAGWTSLAAPQEYGGQGLPRLISLMQREIISGANTAFGTYLGLSQSACSALMAHAAEPLRQMFMPALIDGRWTGTMCLTEPQCGSDLGLITTKAEIDLDGSYRITGTKIFVTGGEHDLSENIVHLVLARTPGAPGGTRGLSLFVVPKFLPAEDGSWVLSNGIECPGIEQKMGIKASATVTLAFSAAKGWLVGEQQQGLRAMFTMMNSSRLGVGIQAVGLAEAALQAARNYAGDRKQGRAAGGGQVPVAIMAHADVRRNLLIARAFVEGARALSLWAGMLLDRHYSHPDAKEQERCEALLALLTPVMKSYFSDRSFQATNSAMQVFGGHGYIRETGVEQYVRDGRIIPLYEGTNGIQAIDLVSRKITLQGGAVAERFFSLVERQVELLVPRRPLFAEALGAALRHLRDATRHVVSDAQADPHANGAAGHDYLQLFGLVAMGFAWAKIVIACLNVKDSNVIQKANEKLKVAEFFFHRELPEATFRYQALKAGSASLMSLDRI